jgi:hypothetical protein
MTTCIEPVIEMVVAPTLEAAKVASPPPHQPTKLVRTREPVIIEINNSLPTDGNQVDTKPVSPASSLTSTTTTKRVNPTSQARPSMATCPML